MGMESAAGLPVIKRQARKPDHRTLAERLICAPHVLGLVTSCCHELSRCPQLSDARRLAPDGVLAARSQPNALADAEQSGCRGRPLRIAPNRRPRGLSVVKL